MPGAWGISSRESKARTLQPSLTGGFRARAQGLSRPPPWILLFDLFASETVGAFRGLT